MKESNSMDCAILSSDRQYAYNIRNRLVIMGVKVSYIDSMHKLITFLISKKSGVLLVDGRFAKLIELINEFALCQNTKNFSFIFLNDYRNVSVMCDKNFTFLSCYENILEDMQNAMISVKLRSKRSKKMTVEFVESGTSFILKALKIPSSLSGYKFIKECVKLLMGFGEKTYSILKDVYRDVGDKYGKGVDNIEKSIRLAIDKSKKNNPHIFKCVFKGQKVSNSTFINLVIDKVKSLFEHSPEF